MKKEYCLENFSNYEDLIKDFLFTIANIVRLTRIQTVEFGLFYIKKVGTDKDALYLKTVNSLKSNLIKKEVNNKKYNDVKQFKNSRFEHWYLKLDQSLKERLEKVGLIVNYYMPEFYGFEDVTFYKNDSLICAVIAHENMAILRLDDNEAKEMQKLVPIQLITDQ